DEYTGSKVMWFNLPLHENQSVGTLVNMIQVGQWYGTHEVSLALQFSDWLLISARLKPLNTNLGSHVT
ncbi:hypothetical protein L208DRAFT_1257547, partial [Tricholoma matsutake]